MDGTRFKIEREYMLKCGRTIVDADAETIGVSTKIKGHETLWIVIPSNYPFDAPFIGEGKLKLACSFENGDVTNVCSKEGWHVAVCLENLIVALERGETHVTLRQLMLNENRRR